MTIYDLIVELEGGYVDHKDDPGGATKYGITQSTLSDYDGKQASKSRVKELTKDEAKDIFAELYGKPVQYEELPKGVGDVILDAAIHMGPKRAIKTAQDAAGSKSDGIMGPNTIKAIDTMSAEAFIEDYQARRMVYLADRPHFPTFGMGWFRRVMKITTHALDRLHGILEE